MTEHEHGVAVVVWRRTTSLDVLLLHRAAFGADFEGNWAWTSPGGARDRGESPESAARRELREETGLELDCEAVRSRISEAHRNVDVAVFVAEASPDDVVALSGEHDRYEWVPVEEVRRCLPTWVADMYHEVLSHLP